jgi:hypothetical protein
MWWDAGGQAFSPGAAIVRDCRLPVLPVAHDTTALPVHGYSPKVSSGDFMGASRRQVDTGAAGKRNADLRVRQREPATFFSAIGSALTRLPAESR